MSKSNNEKVIGKIMSELGATEDRKYGEQKKIYLSNPNRQFFDPADLLIEVVWFRVLENYSKTVGDKEIEEIMGKLHERIFETVMHDVIEEYAKENNWKKSI